MISREEGAARLVSYFDANKTKITSAGRGFKNLYIGNNLDHAQV